MAEKDEIIPVGPGADEEIHEESEERSDEEAAEERAESEEGAEDERIGQAEGDDDDSDERSETRRRRRAERQRKKENRNRDRTELNFLRQRNEQLERRQSEQDARISQGELVLIDNKIAELDANIKEADRIQAMAIEKGDGKSAMEAANISRDLSAGRNQLIGLRQQRANGAAVRAQPAADPAIQMRAKEWAEDHEWYDPNLRNADSRVAKAIEDQLFQEGTYDARGPEYWTELNKRLRKYLPHRFGNGGSVRRDDEDDDREEESEEEGEREERRPRGPQVRVGGRQRPLRKNEVYISAERKEAMIAAGVWNDPVLREKYLKQYQKFDRENRRH